MFLFNLSSLEIGLLAGGGAVLLAVIVVLIVVLCRYCGNKGKSMPKSPRCKRHLCKSGHHHHSTIDLPPLVYMEGTGCSRTNLMGMIDNPLKSINAEEESIGVGGCAVNTLNKTEWKTFDTLGVPRSPREFMYYMRTLEHSRANNSSAMKKKENTAEDTGVYDIKIFSPSYLESTSRNGKDQAKSKTPASPQQGRNTSGALRHPAYRELMQGNTFHVVCTTPCTDMSDSDSEPEFSSPKARLKFTSILEQQSGSTASALNVISRTELHPTFHESKHAIGNIEQV